ncbi:hypothetical protein [Photobacterium galatheae]|uniref:ASP external chaperone domain-containing protein n=1 Tax=Photobacterium galatheae TaxID=1654360 RepID=A0A066RNL7_9GAMM|nr:hypothetical protein [Photobacterium galatheae]KDM92055.1 hypothetical protein EA58_08560 [Photobacterium galatheae]MCM0151030.1 hypothetical protein [Photobacterium galatheae]
MKTIVMLSSLLFVTPALAALPSVEQATEASAGTLILNGVAYQRLADHQPKTRQKRSLSAPLASAENAVLRKGDQLLTLDTVGETVEVTGSFLIRLGQDVDASAFAAQHQLELVYASGEIALLKAEAGRNLLPVLQALENSYQVEQVTLELNSQLNQPQ